MRAALCHPASREHGDLVGVPHRRQSVGDDERRPALAGLRDLLKDAALGFRVEHRRGFVEHQQPGLPQQRTGNGDTLAFTARQALASLTHLRVVAIGHALNGGVQLCGDGCTDDVLPQGVGTAQRDVRRQRVVHQQRVLRHYADAVSPRCGLTWVQRLPVDEHLATVRWDEAGEQADQRRFSRATGADDREGLARIEREIKILKDRPVWSVAHMDLAQFQAQSFVWPMASFASDVLR